MGAVQRGENGESAGGAEVGQAAILHYSRQQCGLPVVGLAAVGLALISLGMNWMVFVGIPEKLSAWIPYRLIVAVCNSAHVRSMAVLALSAIALLTKRRNWWLVIASVILVVAAECMYHL